MTKINRARHLQVNFQRCTASDLEQLTRVAKDTFTDAYGKDNGPFDFSSYIDRAFSQAQIEQELQNQNSEFYFALSSNKLIGYFKINTRRAQTDLLDQNGLELERIYVHSTYQNRGFGQKILDRVVLLAQQRSYPFIWLGVWEQNTRAIEFYRRHGFVHAGYHPFKLGNEDQKDWIMKRELMSKK